jgi:hypothetical protein
VALRCDSYGVSVTTCIAAGTASGIWVIGDAPADVQQSSP